MRPAAMGLAGVAAVLLLGGCAGGARHRRAGAQGAGRPAISAARAGGAPTSGRRAAALRAVVQAEVERGVLVQSVSEYAEFDPSSRYGFVTRTGAGRPGDYVYHVIGGRAPTLTCGPGDPRPTNNLYLKSVTRLSLEQVGALLKGDGEEETRRPFPMGISDLGNGCPTPGIGGQPGRPGSAQGAGRKAVETPLSATPELLVPASRTMLVKTSHARLQRG